MKLFLSVLCAGLCLAPDPQAFAGRKVHVRELIKSQDFRIALEEAKSINHDWPDDIATYQLLAEAHLGLGNYREAESALQWMLDLRIGKADPEGWRLVALFRETTGDLDGALEAASEGYRRVTPGPEQTGVLLLQYMSHLYVQMRKPDLAEKLLLQGKEPAPEALAEIRLAQGRDQEAVAILRELSGRDPRPEYLYKIAEATKDPADYRRFVESARKRTDDTDNANRQLVLFLAGRGKNAREAVTLGRSEYDRRPDLFTADALAVALYADGQTEEARRLMTKTLAIGTRDPGILRHAAAMGLKVDR